MIYSTDYKELYRRVMQGDEVLCFDGDYPYFVFLTHGGRLWLTNRDAKAIDMGTSLELFTGRCMLLSLRYVPDNEGLVTDEGLAIEITARFSGNSRGNPIAKKAFIDGALWAREQFLKPYENE